MERKKNNIKKDFERFKVLWDESVDGNYKNVNELGIWLGKLEMQNAMMSF